MTTTLIRDAAQRRSAGLRGNRNLASNDKNAFARAVPFRAQQLRAKLETRNNKEMYRVEGYASMTETPYPMWDFYGEYEEVIASTAFDKTLAAKPDVAFLVNHRGMTMARTTNGTLELSVDALGLRSVAWLNAERQDVKDLVVAIDDRTIDQMSFGFMLEECEWNDDFSQLRITECDIHRGDVSAVNYGANPYTSIAARSRTILDELDHLPEGVARAAHQRLGVRFGSSSVPTVAPIGRSVSLVRALLEVDA